MDILVTVPDGEMDGAVVELHLDENGFWDAEVRIPAPEQP